MEFETGRRHGPRPVLTPLIDVVFLLLIFFLLTGTFAPTDVFPVTPPVGQSDFTWSGPDLMILVASDGRVALNNRPVLPSELEAILTEGFTRGIESVTIKADSTTAGGMILPVLAIARRAGALRVRLVTLPPR